MVEVQPSLYILGQSSRDCNGLSCSIVLPSGPGFTNSLKRPRCPFAMHLRGVLGSRIVVGVDGACVHLLVARVSI